jgi:hypothetical protein
VFAEPDMGWIWGILTFVSCVANAEEAAAEEQSPSLVPPKP